MTYSRYGICMEGVYSDLQKAGQALDIAVSFSNNSFSEANIQGSDQMAYRPLSESIGAITLHVAESGVVLEEIGSALEMVGGIRPLDLLNLPALKLAKDFAADAEQRFTNATKLVEMILQTTAKTPDHLQMVPVALADYVSESGHILTSVQKEEENIKEARIHIGKALDWQADFPLFRKINQLAENASTLSMKTQEADQYVADGQGEEYADSSRLHTFVGNLRTSIALLESALDRPLDQFASLLTDATRRVGTADLLYLKDLSERLRQGIDAHAVASEMGKEVKLLIFEVRDDINALQQIR